ncbi:Hypothetical predicted protein [Mytilus galloprovincialis]|uniref:Uncharacterized protein n=1 Tax=Mytilus galloprovincialis TaxID=29158 RepID=A0A8B6EPD7_MYTGA|nr:Hypothetical predicted protein [Mytilus galloprovincialis]
MITALSMLPDCIHVGKSIKCSFSNWYLLLNGERSNLSIMQTLRSDANFDVRQRLRKLLNIDCVRNKDRMAVDTVIKISSPEVVDVLRSVKLVVHDIIPERYRPTDDNKPGMYPHPVALDTDGIGNVVFVDFNPMTKKSRIIKARLHNPVNVVILKTELSECKSLTIASGICFVCQHGTDILCLGISRSIGVSVKTLKSKKQLQETAMKLGLSDEGTAESYPSDQDRTIYQIQLKEDGIGFAGNVLEIKKYHDDCYHILSMCLKKDLLYISWKGEEGRGGGVVFLDLVQGLTTRCFSNNTRDCSEVHGICPYKDGIVFADLKSRHVKMYKAGNITTIAGTGEDGCLLGSASHCSFGQPVAVAAENEKNLFVCDVQYGAIKLITGLEGTALFLSCLNKLYLAFGVKSKKNLLLQQTPAESILQIEECIEFLSKTFSDVKALHSLERNTNGADGTISQQTMHSSMSSLVDITSTTNPSYKPNLKSCLTTVVENLHSLSHVKQDLPSKLQYCRDFGNIFTEIVKRITNWSAYYFTKDSSYYPLPDSAINLNGIPKLKKPDTRSITPEDSKLLYDWAKTHGKCVRQRMVRQETTMYKCGTLPLNMYSDKNYEGSALVFNWQQNDENDSNDQRVDEEYDTDDETDDRDDEEDNGFVDNHGNT